MKESRSVETTACAAPMPGLARAAARSQKLYLAFAACCISVVFAFLAIKLFKIQVVEHAAYRERVDSIVRVVVRKKSARGAVLTREGTVVAADFPRYTLAMDPGDPRAAHRRRENPRLPPDYHGIPPEYQQFVIDWVCRAEGLSEVRRRRISRRLEAAREAWASSGAGPLRYLPLARRIEKRRADELIEGLREAVAADCSRRGLNAEETEEVLKRFRVGKGGLCLTEVHHRVYPKGSFLCHVIGSVRPGDREGDLRGLEGIERALDVYLEGRDGQQRYLCDGLRRTRLYDPDEFAIASTDGYNVYLTIDSRVQSLVEEELARGVSAKEAESGVAVVMDCRTGDIVALASYPDYDPARFHDYPASEFIERRRNRAIESELEPGSTMKPLVASMAYEKGLVTLDELLWSGGESTRLLGRPVRDTRDHGPLTFVDAVVHSSNIGMARVGLRLAEPGLNELLDRYRFGVRTAVPLPGEATGKRRRRSQWSEKYTSISVSFGYGLTVTPLQLSAAYCSLVNGGVYYRPRLISRVQRGEEVHPVPVEPLGRVISEETSRVMRGILHQVVERGTGRWHQIDGFPFGGKTGTTVISQGKKGYSGPDGKHYRSSFVGFAPYVAGATPDLVVLVTIEKPNRRLGYYGSVVCGPVVKRILERIYRIGETGLPEGAPIPRWSPDGGPRPVLATVR